MSQRQEQQPHLNENFLTASSDDASLSDDRSILRLPSGDNGIESRTLKALRRTSKQLDGILRDLSKEISRQSVNPVVYHDTDAEMSDDEEHGEKQLKVELDSTVLPNSEGTLKDASPRKGSKLDTREVNERKSNPMSTPRPAGAEDLEQPDEQPEQQPEANKEHPTPVSSLNEVVEKPHENFMTPVGAGDLEQPEQHPEPNTLPPPDVATLDQVIAKLPEEFMTIGTDENISEQAKSTLAQAEQCCRLSSGDRQVTTTTQVQGSTGVKPFPKNKLVKWILCLCLLFVSCVGLVLILVVMLPHETKSAEIPMVAVPTTNTSSLPSLSPNASETSGTELPFETQMPSMWPTGNQTTSVNSQSRQEDQSPPSSSPVKTSDRQVEPPIEGERLDLVPKGYHPKKVLGKRRH